MVILAPQNAQKARIFGYFFVRADQSRIEVTLVRGLVWLARYDGSAGGTDHGGGLVLVDDEIVVTGRSERASNVFDIATVKYDVDGNEIWSVRYVDAKAGSIAADPEGKIYVAGSQLRGSVPKGYVVLKYDEDGNELWVRTYVGPDGGQPGSLDIGLALDVDLMGRVAVAGWSGIQGRGGWDSLAFATVLYDADGTLQWVARYSSGPRGYSPSGDYGIDVAFDGCGALYITGTTDIPDGSDGSAATTIKYVFEEPPSTFLRGDCDGDGRVGGSTTDAVVLLRFAFLGGVRPPCLAACDAEADGVIGVPDAVRILRYGFLAQQPPDPPFPECARSASEADLELGCRRPPVCEEG